MVYIITTKTIGRGGKYERLYTAPLSPLSNQKTKKGDKQMIHIINKIKELLTAYREQLDTLAKAYDIERQEHHNKAIEMRAEGCYTDSYLAEFERNFKPKQDYEGQIKALRDAYMIAYNGLCDKLNAEIDGYFSAPINPNFATKIQTIIASGLKLSDAEFATLEHDADSYLERRLFNQLAISRTDEQGKPNPYPYIDIPSLESIKSRCDELINSGRTLLKTYCGRTPEAEAVLYDYAEIGTPRGYCVNSDIVLKDSRISELSDFLIKQNIAKPIKPLSEDEKALIDTLIEAERYPYTYKERIKECAKNPLLKGMLLRDSRFAEFVPT